MIDFFKRSELVRRGLASGKLRRRRARNGLLRGLEYSWGMKGVLFAAFIAGLAVLIFSGNQPEPTKNFVIALLFFLIALMMLWVNQPRTFSQNSRILLVFGVMLVQLALTKFIYVLCSSGVLRLQTDMAELLTPFALAPLLLSVLLGRNHGLYAAVFVSLWSSVLFGKIDAPLLVTGMISGFTAVYLTLQVRRRSKLVRAGLGVGVAIWILSLTFGFIGPINLFPPTANDWPMIALQSAFAIGNGIVTATIVGGVVPNHHRYFVAGSLRFESPAFAAHDHRSAGHLSPQLGGREPGRSGGGSDRLQRYSLPRLCLFSRCRETGEARLFHRKHELRAQPARGFGPDNECVDHYRAREGRGRSCAQTQTEPAHHRYYSGTSRDFAGLLFLQTRPANA